MCEITQRDIFSYKLLNLKRYEEKRNFAGSGYDGPDSV